MVFVKLCEACGVPIRSIVATDQRRKLKDVKCKGQGTCYAHVPYKKPTYLNHFTFDGLFAMKCCYCASQAGWSILSLREAGCLPCKTDIAFTVTFMMEIKDSKACWAGLSAEIIQIILKFVVKGNRTTPENPKVITLEVENKKAKAKEAKRMAKAAARK